MNEETTIAQQFQKEHLEEILAAKGMVAHISEKLNGLKKEFPNIGFMLHVGIMEESAASLMFCENLRNTSGRELSSTDPLRTSFRKKTTSANGCLRILTKGKVKVISNISTQAEQCRKVAKYTL